jgi:cellobiose-specific phosphotransferase system component IIB
MFSVLLVCQNGLFSQIVVRKIIKIFKNHYHGFQITAKAPMEIMDNITDAAVVIMAPIVSYVLEDMQAAYSI